jgi:ubiquinone/menaquinone biosynthesis C-methylase UbiE
VRVGQRFARLATDAVVRRPGLWRMFRGPLRRQFDRLAPAWDGRRGANHLAPLDAVLDRLEVPPRRVLDLGTGTGVAAIALARRFPEAEIVGLDLSPVMVAQAEKKLTAELRGRVRFETGDAERLPYEDGAFELVTLANMIPFFDEVARVTAPGGSVAFSFSWGAGTPIYVPPERLREELGRRGFTRFAEVVAGDGSALLARR